MMPRHAFTLIELLVVIAIVGLLSTIAIVSLKYTLVKSRDAKRKADFSQISKALELYYQDNGKYPDQGLTSNVCASDWACWASGGGLANALAPYLAKLPQDPYYSHSVSYGTCSNSWYYYVYERLSDNKYCLAGTLENLSDPAIKDCNLGCHSNKWPNYYFTN